MRNFFDLNRHDYRIVFVIQNTKPANAMKLLLPLSAVCALTLTSGAYGQTLANFSAANLAPGQPNLTTTCYVSPVTAASLNQPRGIAVDAASRKVFVADTDNNRVLRYSSAAALASGASAEAVFGQTSFSGANPNNPSVSVGMKKPTALFFDHLGRLWVADTYNNRVLMFNGAINSGNQPTPDKVLGQASLSATTYPGLVAANNLSLPSGLWVEANDRLWVVDCFNRVLRFDSVTNKSNGGNADGVLGQPNFTTDTQRPTDATTIRTFDTGSFYGSSIAVSTNGTLFVAADRDSRVLRFNNAGLLANNSAASSVLGQPDFTTTSSSSTTNAMSFDAFYGFSLTIAANDTLWVSDTGNNRVLRFDSASSKSIGANADGVLGQPDFVSGSPGSPSENAKRLFKPRNLQLDSTGALWVADTEDNRVVRFAPPGIAVDTTKPLLILGKYLKTTKAAKVIIKGTASDQSGVKNVKFRIGTGAIKTATGTTSWSFKATLKKGSNKITVFATDAFGNVSLSKTLTIKRS
jgi:sugar lactone lactonase YvrE